MANKLGDKFYDEKNKELRDAEVIAALKQAIVDYENGAIFEVRCVCQEIANSIQTFEIANDLEN